MPETGTQHRHIDRAEQLESAARLTAREGEGDEERQALFFEGPQEIGKSSLLLEIYERHSANGVYFVDLSRTAAEHDVLESLAMQARRQEVAVPAYRTTRDRFAERSSSPQVDMTNVRMRHATFQLIAQGEDRGLRTASLSDALLDNLVAEARRPVICLDSFEACARPMRDWLARSLLPNLLSRREVSVFVAGRQVPRLSHPDTALVRTLVLPPFDVRAVREWIETLGFTSLTEKAAAIQEANGGVPGLLHEFFADHTEPANGGTARTQDRPIRAIADDQDSRDG
ncbi:hypothetical protein [Streptomyces sp. SID3212]|uniref:hypothetical protein n=1 Tax=Streptomyces sp. SID3212 TaxID=2690259 RepID=UPI00136E90E4|nr:hypothetical protein [Streptomyces sp. SID3212]MYV51694.1 hypothetical protein [Streptomyces sp. SID3212]